MEPHQLALVVAALLCSMVAGLLFAFAAVVMPGLRTLRDPSFIRAFQAIDRVVQDGQLVFGLVVAGSAVALLASLLLGFPRLDGVDRWLLAGAAAGYSGGAILPTVAVNLQLNNRLQTLDVDGLDEATARSARRDFEARWNIFNAVRTGFATATAAALILIVARS